MINSKFKIMFEFCNRLSVGRTALLFWTADAPLDRFAIPASN